VYDVAIVGCGPVGALAANLCGQAGLKTLILEREPAIHPLPRAVACDHETLRILQNAGLAAQMEPHIAPYAPTEYRGVGARLISRFDFAPPPYPLAWAPNYVFRQPAFEAVLRAGFAAYTHVTAKLGCAVEAYAENATGINLLGCEADGRDSTYRARYVLAADGGSSTLRRLCGVEMESLDFDEPWLVVDLLVGERALARLPQTIVQFCDPTRPMTYVIGTGNHRRWEIMLLPGEDPSELARPEHIWRLLTPFVAADEAELWRYAAYRFHALVATRWRHGRILLAGDAAHMTPPFLAQGMVQGLRDVANLSWKLARVTAGTSPATLLDSYALERAPHVRATTATAKTFGQVICELDPARAQTRDLNLLAEFGDPPRVRHRQSLIPGLNAGVIDSVSAAAGTLFPQPMVTLADGRCGRLDDFAGHGVRLVLDGADLLSTVPESALSTLAAIGGRAVVLDAQPHGATPAIDVLACRENDAVLADWLRTHACHAALVRPDHYVYGTAQDGAGCARLCTAFAAMLAGHVA